MQTVKTIINTTAPLLPQLLLIAMSFFQSLPKAHYHTLGEGWNIDQLENLKFCISPQLIPLTNQSSTMPTLPFTNPHSNAPVNLTLHFTVIKELDKMQQAPETKVTWT